MRLERDKERKLNEKERFWLLLTNGEGMGDKPRKYRTISNFRKKGVKEAWTETKPSDMINASHTR